MNYDRFYNQAAAILIRQLSDAATDVGSFWLTHGSTRTTATPALIFPDDFILLSPRIASLPKAELHLHLEGSIQPATVCVPHWASRRLDDRSGSPPALQLSRLLRIYRSVQMGYIVPSRAAGLRLIADHLAEYLVTQNVVYTEVTLSIGVMLLRKQQPEANFEAILRATNPSKAAAYGSAGSSMRHVNSEPTLPWKSSSPHGNVIQEKSWRSAWAAMS